MKHILITIAALLLLPPVGNTQGLIGLGNSALTRITICDVGTGASRNVTAADGFRIQVWAGPAGTGGGDLALVPGTENIGIGTTAGILGGALSAFPLPGYDGGTTVSLQIRAMISGGYGGETSVIQVQLTSAPAAGAVIWQSATGTNPNRFKPLMIACPEPSTLALGALGGLALLFRIKKRKTVNGNQTNNPS